MAVGLALTVDALRKTTDGVEVTFGDRSRAVYGLVVGADGVNSKVRKRIIPGARVHRPYAGRVTADRPPEIDRRTCFLGGPLKVVLTPSSAHEMYLFVLEKSPKVWREAQDLRKPVRQLLEGYGGTVAKIRDGLTDSNNINVHPLEGFILPAPGSAAACC